MRLAKIKFLRFWLIVLIGGFYLAKPYAFAQESPAGGGANPPIEIPMSPGTFPLLDPSIPPLEDIATPDTDVNPQSAENLSMDKAEELTPALVSAEQKWMDDHEGDIQPLLQMWADLFKRAENSDAKRGAEFTNEKIGEDLFSEKKAGFGQMKLTMCANKEGENKRIVKFFYEGKSEALILFQKGEIDPESKQLNQIRTGLTVRGNGEKGWDTVSIVEMNETGDTAETVSHFKKAPALTGQWWADHWGAIVRKPTAHDWSMGAVTGGLGQTLDTAGLAALTMKLHVPGAPPTGWFPFAFTFAFASTLGAFNETYFNFAYSGKFQSLKQLPASMFFLAVMLAHAGHMNLGLKFWVTTAAISLVKKPLSSIPWAQSPKLRMNLRENSGKFRFNLFGLLDHDVVTKWNRARFEKNLWYLIPFTFANADTFFRPWMIAHHLAYNDFTFPVAMAAGAVVAKVSHSLYVWSMTGREVSDEWPQAKADKVQAIWEDEKTSWRKLGSFWNWPTEIKNSAVAAKDSTVKGYNSVIETAPKIYNAIGDHPIAVSLGRDVLDSCSMFLENLGLKKTPMFRPPRLN